MKYAANECCIPMRILARFFPSLHVAVYYFRYYLISDCKAELFIDAHVWRNGMVLYPLVSESIYSINAPSVVFVWTLLEALLIMYALRKCLRLLDSKAPTIQAVILRRTCCVCLLVQLCNERCHTVKIDLVCLVNVSSYISIRMPAA